MSVVVTKSLHFRTRAHGRKVATTRISPLAIVGDRVPRIARLMALAIKFDRMLRTGEVKTISELARRHHVSQPRMTQILNLTPGVADSLSYPRRRVRSHICPHNAPPRRPTRMSGAV
ncbi:MAG: hypothetical protein KF724_12985 [Phycisphaeraceae bacterium]|nr:hypothetical protein [Phycisphaeraceae bacterium]